MSIFPPPGALDRTAAPFSDLEHHELLEQLIALRAEVESLRAYRAIAYHDALTGLRNRRYLTKRLDEEVSRAARGGAGAKLSVIFVDLDDFKQINDELGHAAGDATLKWVAKVVSDGLRGHDVVCRTGGDEFVVVCPGADAADCEVIIDRLQARLEAEGRGRVAPVRASMGSASWHPGIEGAEALLARADSAMYRAKTRKLSR